MDTKDEDELGEMHFSLHGMLNFVIKGPTQKTKIIGQHYSHFLTDQILNPDFEFVIGKFKVDNGDTELINNKYYVKENHFFCKDVYKLAKWQIYIRDLEAEKTQIFFDGNTFSNTLLLPFIFEPLLAFKLTNRGHSVLHASSVDVGGRGFAFAGYPGTGKTSILLELINRGYKYLSEELSLLDRQGMLYGCATPLNIYAPNLVTCPSLQHKIPKKGLTEIYLKNLIYRVSLGYVKFPYGVDLKTLSCEVGNQSPLEAITLVSTSKNNNIAVEREENKEDFAARLALISHYQFYRFYEYLNAYSLYMAENSTYKERVYENILASIRKAKCYKMAIPLNQIQRAFSELKIVLQESGE